MTSYTEDGGVPLSVPSADPQDRGGKSVPDKGALMKHLYHCDLDSCRIDVSSEPIQNCVFQMNSSHAWIPANASHQEYRRIRESSSFSNTPMEQT